MILAIRDDPELSRWFETIECLATHQRAGEIWSMRRKLMAAESAASDELAGYLALLADERVFQAASMAYRSG